MSIRRLLQNKLFRQGLSKLVNSACFRRVLNNATLGRLVIAIRIGKVINILRFMFWAVSSIPLRPRSHRNERGAMLKRWKTPLRGKRGLNPREKTEPSLFRCNLYFHVLRLPWPLFLMCMAGTYFVTSVIFASLYYLDVDGLHVERSTSWPAWVERVMPSTGRSMLTVFFYSCSISTNFSQSNVDAHSLYTLFLGNVHALVMQLITVFWCSALCERISQPVKVVRWSTVGVITGDGQSAALAGINCRGKYRVLTLRFDLLGAYTTGLIDAKFDVLCLNTSLKCQLLSRELTLVRKGASSITRGALLQHVIDESSPLHGCDVEAMRDEDYIFEASVRAVERTTMRQVFSEHHYSVHDGEILWDCEFEDQIYSDEDGNSVYDHTLLDSVREVKDSRCTWDKKHYEMKFPVGVAVSKRRSLSPNFWKCLLWLILVFSGLGRQSTGVKAPPQT